MPLTFLEKVGLLFLIVLFEIQRVKRITQAGGSCVCEILGSCSYVWLDWKYLEGSECLTRCFI